MMFLFCFFLKAAKRHESDRTVVSYQKRQRTCQATVGDASGLHWGVFEFVVLQREHGNIWTSVSQMMMSGLIAPSHTLIKSKAEAAKPRRPVDNITV